MCLSASFLRPEKREIGEILTFVLMTSSPADSKITALFNSHLQIKPVLRQGRNSQRSPTQEEIT